MAYVQLCFMRRRGCESDAIVTPNAVMSVRAKRFLQRRVVSPSRTMVQSLEPKWFGAEWLSKYIVALYDWDLDEKNVPPVLVTDRGSQ